MVGLKVSILGLQIGKNWVFSPISFLGGTYEHPYMADPGLQFGRSNGHVVSGTEEKLR